MLSVESNNRIASHIGGSDPAATARQIADTARMLPNGMAMLGELIGTLRQQSPAGADQLTALLQNILTPVERGQLAAALPATTPVSGDAPASYTVRAGDTLSEIAQAHGTSWQALARANNLSNPDLIRPGQRIMIAAPDLSTDADRQAAAASTRHAIDAVQATDTKPAARADAGGAHGVSAAGLDAIHGREAQAGVSNRLHWPGGASGVTLGPGYDLRHKNQATIVADLTGIGVDRGTAQQIAEGAGLTGAAARRFAADNRGLVNLSAAQERALLSHTVAPYADAVRQAVKVPLTQNQFDALVSFTYNIGTPGFQGSTVLRRLNAGDSAGAADAMRMWNKSDGQVMAGLVNRREAEIRQFNTPGPALQTPGAPAVPQRAAPAPLSRTAGNDFVERLMTQGDAQAQADFNAGRKVVVALRTDTNLRANPNGRYDDRIAVVWKGADGRVNVREFAGNTEPSGQYAWYGAKGSRGYGVDMNGDGRRDLGRIEAGSYRYTQQADRFLGNTYFRPDQTTPAQRDTNGDGRFDAGDRNGRDRSGAGRSMLIHQGGSGNTWSAGCQTLASRDFNAFVAALGGQRSFSYVLVDATR